MSLAVISVLGCGGEGRLAVQGNVRLEGKPIEEGRIVFTPTQDAGKRPQAIAVIKDGAYSLPASEGPLPGSYRVEVYSPKKTGKTIPTPGDPTVTTQETREMVPAEFNKASKLTVAFEAGKPSYDFDLKK